MMMAMQGALVEIKAKAVAVMMAVFFLSASVVSIDAVVVKRYREPVIMVIAMALWSWRAFLGHLCDGMLQRFHEQGGCVDASVSTTNHLQ
ncbi:hypothetical protein MTO96_020719 [Rhipicephalus appendiculatus]